MSANTGSDSVMITVYPEGLLTFVTALAKAASREKARWAGMV